MFRERSDDQRQPHIVQLAVISDEDGDAKRRENFIVRPDGWVIPDEVSLIHGITTEIAMSEPTTEFPQPRISETEATKIFWDLREKSALRVAHNVTFDDRIMRIAALRSGFSKEKIEQAEAAQKYCTMTSAKPIVNIPPTAKMMAAGFHGPKPPTVKECIKYFFAEEFSSAHDAMNDAEACRRIYYKLVAQQ